MESRLPIPIPVFLAIMIWSLAWKGIGLWRAAKLEQKNWFVVLLLFTGDLGISAIVYLFFFAKKKLTLKEIHTWLPINK